MTFEHPEITTINRTGYPSGMQETSTGITCSDCGEPILVNEYYYDIDGKIICDDCIESYVHCNWGDDSW